MRLNADCGTKRPAALHYACTATTSSCTGRSQPTTRHSPPSRAKPQRRSRKSHEMRPTARQEIEKLQEDQASILRRIDNLVRAVSALLTRIENLHAPPNPPRPGSPHRTRPIRNGRRLLHQLRTTRRLGRRLGIDKHLRHRRTTRLLPRAVQLRTLLHPLTNLGLPRPKPATILNKRNSFPHRPARVHAACRAIFFRKALDMVKVNGPLMSFDASGTIAKTATFSKWKGRNYVRSRVIPSNPQSAAQVSMRSMMKFLSQIWAGLTAANKATWDTAADASAISPFNAFVAGGMARWNSYKSPSKEDPAAEAGAGGAAPTTTPTAGVKEITLSIADGAPP